jgi:proteasome lid subunit RPN8/RPN11
VISLPAALAQRIRDEGEKAHPNECCGFILGKIVESESASAVRPGRFAEDVIPIVNSREAEEQYHRFVIEPEDFMRAEKEARRRNCELLGFYHSHPDHPALPSDYDREHALPFYSYIIVAVDAGQAGTAAKPKAGVMSSWRLAEDRSIFNEEEIVWQ